MIRVMIVDDQPLIRDGLAMLLNLRPEIEIVAVAEDGADAVAKAVELQPDIVLMDIRMPGVNGVEGTSRIQQCVPAVKVIMLTTFKDSELIFEALEKGASGYLLKDMPTDTIVQAILTAHAGGLVLPPEMTGQILVELRKTKVIEAEKKDVPYTLFELTEREIEVLKEIGYGLNNREIAEKLYITEGTVKNHVSSLIHKLALRDRTQAAIFAVRHGISEYV
ncbi:response regulator transcription factor [Ectobacillus antri]|jgi:DNA-binding NarL/FixJ family response regulator|uniref:Response regulator transcription factor n=1 Tax=Ectobacillus antri TaxID=2486280 RepID=A0ABT6H8E7_9BACI|nr:response regulator transcription factor [Ectobacillus antri]MDG4657932.1 response regulator transcription factor [Ectobacillus antri]MDG5754984.1 response regulator transcription factor [Ectobacillus antri]